MIRKKISLLSLILISVLLFTSCLNPVQLSQRAIVQAVGVDLEDDGQLKLTLQVFAPAVNGGGGISATADNAKIIEAKGETVSQAVQNATLVQGKQLFVGHNRVIIIGAELAKKGLNPILSYFSSSPYSRQSVQLIMAKDRADAILKARINQGMLPAETLEKIIKNTQESGIFPTVQLYRFLQTLESEHDSAVLPVMSLVQKSPENSSNQDGGSSDQQGGGDQIDEVSSVAISEVAVFSGTKLAGTLGERDSRGLLWIRGDVKKTVLTLSAGQYEKVSLQVHDASSRLTPKIQGGKAAFSLSVHCDAAIRETVTQEGYVPRSEDVDLLASAAEKLIREECLAAFQHAGREFRTDVFHMGNLVWQKDAAFWKTLRENWQEQMDQVGFTVDVAVDLDRVGLEFR